MQEGITHMIYLDNAATTQPTKRALEIYQQAQHQLFYNSESLHIGGEKVKNALTQARTFVQQYFQSTKEVLFGTSGSHVNEIAIHLYLKHQTSGQVWVSPYEHPSITAALEVYRDRLEIQTIPLTEMGEIDIPTFQTLVTEQTVLIITQHVNSETGYILPIQQIAQIAKQWNIPFHVDGVQAVHKVPSISIDSFTSYSFSGHKIHGTKGSGVLMIDYAYIHPYNAHYFHEQGVRNGTMDVPSILATVQALSEPSDYNHLQRLYQHAVQRATELKFRILKYNAQAPHILGLITPKYEGQYMMQMLSNRNICISTGTACGHGILMSNGVTQKIKASDGEVYQYIRVSFASFTTFEEIDTCFDVMANILFEGGSQ